jgi:O-acetyl-ADP-ribose deacetylase (regulator of RNase III)
METIRGNLLEYFRLKQFDTIIHGCNCFNTMGAGIAKQIKEQYPEAYKADLKTKKGDINKLGNCSHVILYEREYSQIIINAYTQYRYGGKSSVDYDAIEKVFTRLNEWDTLSQTKMGIPFIGSGYAGGDWEKIKGIIERVTPNLNITAVEFR